jgi:hypothetical protein
MKQERRRSWTAAATALLLLFAAAAFSESAGAESSGTAASVLQAETAEIERLERSVARFSRPDPDLAEAIARARGELEAGHLYAALDRLQSPFAQVAMRDYLFGKDAIRAPAQFEAEWKGAGKALAREEAGLKEERLANLPAAARALVEVNRAQSREFYRSAFLYGRQTNARNGLAYTGLAKGHLDFAVWTASLGFPPAAGESTPSPRSRIQDLERRVLAAYDRPGTPSMPGWFNTINAALKTAKELDAAGRPEGALQQLLDAELFFAVVSAEGSPAPPLDALRRESSESHAAIGAAPGDQSMATMYWEIAEGNLEPGPDGSVPADRLKKASAVYESVLPRILRPPVEVAAERAAAVPAKVRITLVRWPYT